MLFSSIPFLMYFLPAVLAVYYVVPKKAKNAVLLVFSLLFYSWGEPKHIFVMLVSILTGYVSGLIMERIKGSTGRKLCLVLSVFVPLGLLVYFKYAGFLVSNALTVLKMMGLGEAQTGPAPIALPLGISFYTFQIISYVVDVYKGDIKANKNPADFALYVSFFPQLIAGPIVRYTDMKEQLAHRSAGLLKVSEGVRRFLLGLSKKVLIANGLGELCSVFRSSSDLSVLYYWLYAIAFMLHLYFDFSGYSDMAIGLGKMFGFTLPENFDYPYISGSITEFWRRWHMSLGRWFRDYVYIPLGGNRVGYGKWFRNIFLVWMLTGFWHGADWNFIVWGLFFAVWLVLEKWFLLPHLQKARIWNHMYVLLLVLFSFVIFHAENMAQAGADFSGLFGFSGIVFCSAESLFMLRKYAVLFGIAILGATPFPKRILNRLQETDTGKKCFMVAEPIFLLALLVMVMAYLVDGSYNPFLYFRF